MRMTPVVTDTSTGTLVVPINEEDNEESQSPKKKKSRWKKSKASSNIVIPFPGTEFPIIDGEGATSYGREGTGLKKTAYISERFNDYELLATNHKEFVTTSRAFTTSAGEKGGKLNKIVYDCLSSSPFYQVKDYYSTYNRITIDRRPVESVSAQEKSNLCEKLFKQLPTFYIPNHDESIKEDDDTLVFESRFESGNLWRVFQKGRYEYDLILKTDHNTSSFTQWFYFKIMNTWKNKTYRINIINLIKPDSLYNNGMKVLQYSLKNATNNWNGWFWGGRDILYKQNSYKK